MLHYAISVAQAHAHVFSVSLTVDAIVKLPLTVSLPVWIPGSYTVRDFARHLSGLRARAGRKALRVVQLDKTTWRIDEGAAAMDAATKPTPGRALSRRTSTVAGLRLDYEVYGFDPSVRASYLDADRAFFNGTSLLLCAHGFEHMKHRVRLTDLPKGWKVATAMPRVGRHTHEARNYDEAIDHPFELGTFWQGTFVARGVEHTMVVRGAWPSFDGERLLKDTQRICEAALDFWHGRQAPKSQAARAKDVPFDRYVFMLHAVEDGYGGLEHRASTALIASRADLPRRDEPKALSDGYVGLLGLISHEYFHTWNVKRLKPAEHATLNLRQEQPTELLWFFEGFTSYYDDLLLCRAGLIDEARYLQLVAKTLNGLLNTPGRLKQSVAQASFDAWTKYYKADENTPNTCVSYYTKGSMVALALDLSLRMHPNAHLDGVMRRLWRKTSGGAMTEADLWQAVADELSPHDASTLLGSLRHWVHGVNDAPWLELLRSTGVDVRDHDASRATSLAAALGIRVAESVTTGVVVKHVLSGGAAQRAGVAVGDEILAVDGLRLRRLDEALAWFDPQGSQRALRLTLTHQQRLVDRVLKAPFSVDAQIKLSPSTRLDGTTLRRRQRWLVGH